MEGKGRGRRKGGGNSKKGKYNMNMYVGITNEETGCYLFRLSLVLLLMLVHAFTAQASILL